MTAYEVRSEPVAGWVHGKSATYKNGCRCEPCRTAGALANADYRARKRTVQGVIFEGRHVGFVVEEEA